MSQSAKVYLYADLSTGWVIGYGDTANQKVDDPTTEAIVPLNDTAAPSATKPLWRQRVDAGEFGDSSTDDRDKAKIWLASKFQSSEPLLFRQTDPLNITDSDMLVLGTWLSDSRTGEDNEGAEGRVFGAVFKWSNPVLLRPPVFECVGFNPAREEKHRLKMHGEPVRTKTDSATSWEFWKVVTSKNAPLNFRQWELQVSVPTIVASEVCTLESLRLSNGKRGAE